MELNVRQLIEQAKRTGNHFTELRRIAGQVISDNQADNSMRIGKKLFLSEVHQARSLATCIFGLLSANEKQCLNFLRTHVSKDEDWRVQEFLAQAFDRFCSDIGYEKAQTIIKDWLSDSNPNVRRAVTEGLRIWTSRPYFKDHPKVAISLLGRLRADESEYVRKSVGNALRDISKIHTVLVRTEIRKWDLSNKKTAMTYKLASRFL